MLRFAQYLFALLLTGLLPLAARAQTAPAPGSHTVVTTNTVTAVSNNVTIVTTTITTTTTIVSTTPAGTNSPAVAGAIPGKTIAPGTVTPPAPPAKWQNTATFGATVAKGNSDSVLLTAALNSQKKTARNEYDLEADASYGEQDNIESVDRLHGSAQVNHLYSPRLYSYLRADALHDAIAGIDYQVSLSPGAGYYFLKSTNTTLSGEAGPGVAIERLGDVHDTYATLRIGQKYDHKFSANVHLWESVDFQPEIDRFEKYSIDFEVGVETIITKTLSLKTMLQDNYVNLPAVGRKDNDVKLVSGITYKF
jgi:putative salt-induced outer membrane protein YdiY